ncbi:hypothetical protein NUSPORA_02577 [Nucleospora cyclopteri]
MIIKEIIFNYNDIIKIDKNKQFFYKDSFICTLNRNLFAVEQTSNFFLLIDRVGDCFKFDGEKMEFLFGILSLPTDFRVEKDLIVVNDSFNREFIYNYEGRIKTVKHIY